MGLFSPYFIFNLDLETAIRTLWASLLGDCFDFKISATSENV